MTGGPSDSASATDDVPSREAHRCSFQAEQDSRPAAESPSGYAARVHVFFERKTHDD